jgi:hypothetical protein
MESFLCGGSCVLPPLYSSKTFQFLSQMSQKKKKPKNKKKLLEIEPGGGLEISAPTHMLFYLVFSM